MGTDSDKEMVYDVNVKLKNTMDRYTFDPIQVTFGTYGRECLQEGREIWRLRRSGILALKAMGGR